METINVEICYICRGYRNVLIDFPKNRNKREEFEEHKEKEHNGVDLSGY